MRFVFFGSPPFATPVLTRLLASPHELCGLVTMPERRGGRGRKALESPLVTLATERAVPVWRPENPHDPDVLAGLAAVAADVYVIASYGKILKPVLFDAPPHGSLNVHASLLPRHRGASPIQRAILEGDPTTGVSLQRIVTELDAGDVLLSLECPIEPGETSGQLAAKLAELGGEGATRALDVLASGDAHFEPQDVSRATYAKKLAKEDGRVDWTQSAEAIERLARAMTPWPGARTNEPGGRELTLIQVAVADQEPGAEPGSVLTVGERLVVATGSGALAIDELKPAGKRAMNAADYLRGARLAVGDRLGEPA